MLFLLIDIKIVIFLIFSLLIDLLGLKITNLLLITLNFIGILYLFTLISMKIGKFEFKLTRLQFDCRTKKDIRKRGGGGGDAHL